MTAVAIQGDDERLPRQLQRLDGLCAVAVEPKRNRLASPQLPEPRNAPIDTGPAFPTLALAMEHSHHHVTGLPRLLNTPVVALPSGSDVLAEPPNPIGPFVC